MKFAKHLKKGLIPGILCAITFASFAPQQADAWTDQTHMAIALAAGLKSFNNACAPDISHAVAKLNNLPKTDSQAHFFDANRPITKKDVYDQLDQIGQQRSDGNEGYVLGEILHVVREAKERTAEGKFDDYYYDVLAHYVGDMSQPLHMTIYDAYNRSHHLKTDMILDRQDVKYDVDGAEIIAKELKVNKNVVFHNEDEIVNALVILANQSHNLATQLRKENRMITQQEAITQASRAATVLHALLVYCGKKPVDFNGKI